MLTQIIALNVGLAFDLGLIASLGYRLKLPCATLLCVRYLAREFLTDVGIAEHLPSKRREMAMMPPVEIRPVIDTAGSGYGGRRDRAATQPGNLDQLGYAPRIPEPCASSSGGLEAGSALVISTFLGVVAIAG
jgi:hypothetical protein